MDNGKIKFSERRHLVDSGPGHDQNFELCKTLVPYEVGKVHFRESRVDKPYVSGKCKVENPITTR